jgi:DNA-binding NarL/FixJ family response regulator
MIDIASVVLGTEASFWGSLCMPGDGSSIAVMIVEDQEIVRQGLKVMLQRHSDMKIIADVPDGQQAILLLKDLSPDVVIMDIGLPGTSGVDIVRMMKRERPGLRILMLTARDGKDDVVSAFTAGANSYCLKGTAGNDIATAVRATASGAAWLDRGIAGCVIGGLTSDSNRDRLPPTTQSNGSVLSKSRLSAREIEVLQLIVEGFTNNQIADSLKITSDTVKTHMRHIMEKLAVCDRTEAAAKAIREGIVT